jgi:hypothetical protein
MKKVFSIMSAFAILVLVFSTMLLCVNAHSGNTDGSGGHTDHSTGEYHYHHGYPAHSHYDMDGDGDVDCPYEFHGKTDHTSNNDGGNASAIEDTHKTDSKSEKISPKGIIATVFESMFFAIVIWLFSSYFLFYLFGFILGENQGCSISMITGAVISIVATIWILCNKLS